MRGFLHEYGARIRASRNATVAQVLLLAGLLGACGEVPLTDLGSRASGWIDDVSTTRPAVRPTIEPSSPLLSVDFAAWYNAAFVPALGAQPEEVIARVYERGASADRYVQAGPEEIALALPGVEFPSLVPSGSVAITSQLVFAPRSSQLDQEVAAAFGVWTVEPYSRSRSVGQIATLEVAVAPEEATAVAAGAADLTCARFEELAGTTCSEFFLEGDPAWRLKSDSGNTLVWYRGVYRYRMFGRTTVTPEVLLALAGSTEPLATLVGSPGSR